MKKILAGLLSLALLLGSVPVYGAEDAILSQPNTENITEQSELSETAENSGETGEQQGWKCGPVCKEKRKEKSDPYFCRK